MLSQQRVMCLTFELSPSLSVKRTCPSYKRGWDQKLSERREIMYGLLLDTIQKFIREKYGESYWVNIRRRANLSNHWFVTHEVGKPARSGQRRSKRLPTSLLVIYRQRCKRSVRGTFVCV